MSNDTKHYQNITVSDQENSEIQITGEITAEKLHETRTRALERAREEAEIDGFRKGSAPDDVLINHFGEMTILQNAAEIALNEEYPSILADHKVNAIGQPQVSITKLSPGEPLGFTIQTAVMPEFTLPDYKKVAAEELAKDENKIQEPEVEEKEVDDVVLQIRRNMAAQQQNEGEEAPSDESLPELDDAFVQTIGFESVKQFRDQIRQNITQEKRNKEVEKRQISVLEAIISQSDITLPEIVVTNELEKMSQQLKQDIANAGYEYEEYLKQAGKTEEDLRSEWRPQAIKKAKTQLILNRIVANEGLVPDQEQVNQQVEQLLKQYPDAEQEQVKVFVETQLQNQKALELLDNQAPDGDKSSGKDTKKEEAKTDTKKKSTAKSKPASAKKSTSKKKAGGSKKSTDTSKKKSE